MRFLAQAIGEFRDYNGGTFEVQQRSFSAFKEGLPESEELLLERFFYGIEPAFMQRVLDSEFLKEGYALLKSAVRKEFDVFPFAFLDGVHGQGVIIAIASPFLKSTDELFQDLFALRHTFPSLAFCSLWMGRIFAFLMFYSTPDVLKQNECLAAVQRTFLLKKGSSSPPSNSGDCIMDPQKTGHPYLRNFWYD